MNASLAGLKTFAKNNALSLRAALGLLVLVASIVAFIASQKVPPVRASVVDARLELAAGEVRLTQGPSSTTVISGEPLPTGAELQTGKGARALIRLSDGSSLFLRSDTTVRISPEGAELVSGEVWLDAPPSERGGLKHKAGDVSVSAVDAGLSWKRAGAEVSIVVTRGLAVLTSPGGRVEVNAGEQATASGADKPKTSPVVFWDDWTGGMGDGRPLAGTGSGAGRIYGVQPGAAGEKAKVLEISRQAVRAVIRDGLAETEVDQTFSNPGGGVLEGWYWFSVPERAIVTSFAVETNGVLVEGEVTERKEAATKYAQAMATGHQPALLEWVDGRTYRSRIYPIPASGQRRVVLRYLEVLPSQGGKVEYLYPMRSDDPGKIGEFSLLVDLGQAGTKMRISSLADAVVEERGRRVTMRRSGYLPRADFQLEATPMEPEKRAPLTLARFRASDDRADYVMARYVPDVDWTAVAEPRGDVAVVVDTSASGDDSVRQQKAAAAEAILRSLSAKDKFVLIAIDSAPTVLWPKEGLAEATDKEIAGALARLSEHAAGGATDLGALFDAALGPLHGADQPAVVYIGDGLPTSGELSGERLSERLRRSLSTSRARLFTVAVGSQSNVGLLNELAREGGGQSFRIDRMETATSEVLRLASAIKTPTVTDLEIDLGAGLDEAMITASGKISRGQEALLFARTHHTLPKEAVVTGRLFGKEFKKTYPIVLMEGTSASLVPRLWAAEKVRRLLGAAADPDAERGKIVEIGLEYGLMTPFTSILALESEEAYARQGIRRRYSPLRGVHLTELDAAQRRLLDSLANPMPQVAMGCYSKSSDEAPASVSVAPAPQQVSQPMVADPGADQKPMDLPAAAATAVPEEPEATRERQEATKPMGGKGASEGMDEEGYLAKKPEMLNAPPPPPQATIPMPKPEVATLKPPAFYPAKPGPASTVGLNQASQVNQALGVPMPKPKPTFPLLPCSDVARRPLADRIVLWSKRLRGELDGKTLVSRYEAARGSCEIPDWRAEQALLDLIQQKARTEEAVLALLEHLASRPDTRAYVAQAILRRTVDMRIAAAVRRTLFGEKVRWEAVDAELAVMDDPEKKIAKLREWMLVAPGDPEGDYRIVRLLSESGKKDDALAYGRRLRERGFMSPTLALSLGDVFAEQGFEDDALRTYSEIVEFDPTSPDSRRLLGDVFLRHGWYAAAYRQYRTLSDLLPTDPTSYLRLAMAAAGSGRVDEALRIERQVASAEGTPGPKDPRLFARLLSAATLARLLDGDGKAPDLSVAEGVSRKLKELSLFSGPSVLLLLAWEDMEADLVLVAKEAEKDVPIAEIAESSSVGISALEGAPGDEARQTYWARWRKASPGREVALTLYEIAWDGKAFRVKMKRAKLGVVDREVAL